ncbi:MAG TPA: hypothetical protein EYG92_00210 [Lutibacter sp.]|nr:hypothetical protein [Lutibacter sp.]
MIWGTRLAVVLLTIIVIPIFKINYLSGVGIGLILIGAILNLIAMEVNGGKMPVFNNENSEKNIIYEFGKSTHNDGINSTKFPLLCDGVEINIPMIWFAIRYTISIGDIAIGIGLLLFLGSFPWFAIVLLGD